MLMLYLMQGIPAAAQFLIMVPAGVLVLVMLVVLEVVVLTLDPFSKRVEKNSVQRLPRTINSVGPCPLVLPSRGKPMSTGCNGDHVLPPSVLRVMPV